MLLRILRFLFGYVKVNVYGYASERVINYMVHNKLVLWNVEPEDDGYVFFTGRSNIYFLQSYLHRTNCKLNIIEKHGLPYVYQRYKGRFVFVFGILFCLWSLYILSLFIWEIDVKGDKQLIGNEIKNTIETEYVSLGTRKRSVDCEKLEDALRERFDMLSWISCSIEGTKLTICLEEGCDASKNNSQYVSDLVASKDAIITDMVTRNGTPLVKIGDKVNKGDILISGNVYLFDDNNEILETNQLCADGDVYGLTTYDYDDYVDLTYYEKKYDAREKNYIGFYFLRYDWLPVKPDLVKGKTDICTVVHKCRILNDFYLPLGYKLMTTRFYSLEKKQRSVEEATKLLKVRLNKKIIEFKEKKVEIIRNNVKIEQVNGRITAKGRLQLKESISKRKKIK